MLDIPGYTLIRSDDWLTEVEASAFMLGKIKSVGICVTHRPPNFSLNSYLDCLERSIEYLSPMSDLVFCLGDLNVDLLKPESSQSKKIQTFFEALDILQLINEPTRITSSSKTLINLILTSDHKLCAVFRSYLCCQIIRP
nr:unnamed protein product [Callosobruchus analis]